MTRIPTRLRGAPLRANHFLLLDALAKVRNLDLVAFVLAADGRQAVVTVNVEELGQVEFRLLKHLDFADVAVLQGVDAVARLLDLLANDFRNELVDELLQLA